MWLDEIEKWLNEDSIGKVDEYELTKAIGYIDRMARVLREQSVGMKTLDTIHITLTAWGQKQWFSSPEAMIDLVIKACAKVLEGISDDAKELLDISVAASDDPESEETQE